MNVVETVSFTKLEMEKLSPGEREFMEELVHRLEVFRVNMLQQLRNEPTVFYANPETELEKIEGHKVGDLAVWVDDLGESKVKVLI